MTDERNGDPVNWSTLKEFRKSPLHYRHRLQVERADTDAFLQGRVTHCLLYEPHAFHDRYVEEPRFHRGMKDETAIAKGYDGGKETAKEFTEQIESSGSEVVPAEIMATAKAMQDSIMSNRIASPFFGEGYSEQIVYWTDHETGIECRGRVDHLNGRLSDLKTAQDVSPRIFAAAVARYGYHAQLAFYSDGLEANGLTMGELPAIIAVESKAPFDVVVYEFGEEQLAAGRTLYRKCLRELSACRATDTWPGIGGGAIQPMVLPEWAMPDASKELTIGGVSIF